MATRSEVARDPRWLFTPTAPGRASKARRVRVRIRSAVPARLPHRVGSLLRIPQGLHGQMHQVGDPRLPGDPGGLPGMRSLREDGPSHGNPQGRQPPGHRKIIPHVVQNQDQLPLPDARDRPLPRCRGGRRQVLRRDSLGRRRDLLGIRSRLPLRRDRRREGRGDGARRGGNGGGPDPGHGRSHLGGPPGGPTSPHQDPRQKDQGGTPKDPESPPGPRFSLPAGGPSGSLRPGPEHLQSLLNLLILL